MHKKLGFKFTDLPKIRLTDKDSLSYKETYFMIRNFFKENFTDFYIRLDDNREKTSRIFQRLISLIYDRENYRIYLSLQPNQLNTIETLKTSLHWVEDNYGISHFDFLSIENLTMENDYEIIQNGVMDELIKLKLEGKIDKLGFSFYDTPKSFEQILNCHHEMDFVELPLNYLDLENENLPFLANYKIASQYNKKIFATHSLKGGCLVTKTPADVEEAFVEERPDLSMAAWAVKYVCSLAQVETCFVSMNSSFDVIDNITFLTDFMRFKKQDFQLIKKMAERTKLNLPFNCNNCMKCVAACDFKLNIPGYIAMYNSYKYEDNATYDNPLRKLYSNYALRVSSIKQCTRCGDCEMVCEKALPLCDIFDEMQEAFEPEGAELVTVGEDGITTKKFQGEQHGREIRIHRDDENDVKMIGTTAKPEEKKEEVLMIGTSQSNEETKKEKEVSKKDLNKLKDEDESENDSIDNEEDNAKSKKQKKAEEKEAKKKAKENKKSKNKEEDLNEDSEEETKKSKKDKGSK